MTGKGGDVTQISEIEIKTKCDVCNHITYSSYENGLKIDESQWDGSDFFTVWPLPRFILVTERVKKFIEEHKLRNVKFTPIEKLIGKGKTGGLSPGNYQDWLNNR